MKKRVLISVLVGAMTMSLMACGGSETSSNENTTNASEQNEVANNEESDSSKADENETSKENASGVAYDFATDSKNQKIKEVNAIDGTDLYLVHVNAGSPAYYVMDGKGKTVAKSYDKVNVTLNKRYIYKAKDEHVMVYDVVEKKDVTPDGVNEYMTALNSVRGDIYFTGQAAYDLTTGERLWSSDDKFELISVTAVAKNLMICNSITNGVSKHVVFNYTTGKNLCKDIINEYEDTQIQMNSAGYFCVVIGDKIKVYNSNGELDNEFTVPSGYVLDNRSMFYAVPGEHFAFTEDKKDPKKMIITDIKGNVVKEEVFVYSGDSYTYSFYTDRLIVRGALNGSRDFYSGMLDSSMNWMVSQTDKVYEKITWLYGDVYYAENDGKEYLYNPVTKTEGEIDGYYQLRYYTDNSMLIPVKNKMYNAKSFKLVDIEYKDKHTYTQISETTFAEYEKNDMSTVVVYDYEGKVVATLELGEGKSYVAAAGNSIIVYSKAGGYELVTVE